MHRPSLQLEILIICSFDKPSSFPYSDPNENCPPMLAFSSMNNLRLNNNFPVVRKIITLDFTEASILDSVQTMILKNCKTQFSCILANLVDICLKEPFYRFLKLLTCKC